MLLRKFHIWDKCNSLYIGQNMVNQSYCSIFTSAMCPEQIDEILKGWFLACWYMFIKIKSLLRIFGVGMDKNVFDHPFLAVSREWIDGIKRFFACGYKFCRAESYLNGCWVFFVKSWCDLLVYGTDEYPVSQEWDSIYDLSWFFKCW